MFKRYYIVLTFFKQKNNKFGVERYRLCFRKFIVSFKSNQWKTFCFSLFNEAL